MRLPLIGLVALCMGDGTLALAPKILVLGGTGFIGSTISKIAVDSGCQVRVYLNHVLQPLSVYTLLYVLLVEV